MSSMSNSLYDRIHEQSHTATGQPILEVSNNTTTGTSKPLNFNKAMDDFRTMFPHIDPDVIETVLRANDGVVQVTIDQLLVLSEEITAEQSQGPDWPQENHPRLPGYSESIATPSTEEPPPAYSEIDVGGRRNKQSSDGFGVALELPGKRDATSVSGRSSSRNWKAPLVGNLPDDFLRLSVDNSSPRLGPSGSPVSNQRHSSSGEGNFYSDDQVERFLEDEKLAMFLQNEEFIRELRHNPDFIMSLEEDHRQFITSQGDFELESPTADGTSPPSPMGGTRPKVSGSQDDVVFRHKLKHMGKTTRRKFGKLAKRFSRKKGSKPPLHGESTANLLEDEIGNEEQQGIDSLTGISEDGSDSRVTSPELDRSPREEQLDQRMTGRRLPPVPSPRSPSHDEPIVFYSEDNEFAYKAEH